MPQGRGTIADLTVDENLRLGAYARRDREVDADIERWYAMFPRLGRAARAAGGEHERRRAADARDRAGADGRGRKLVLLDEPSLGLAPIVTQELFQILGDLNREQGLSMLVVEQNASLALGIAQRAATCSKPAPIAVTGAADELAGNDDVRRAYLGI